MRLRFRKRWLRWTGWIVGGLAALLLTLPVWWPWILRPVARHFGFHFVQYERRGYSRFVLTEVAYQIQNTRVEAEEAEAFIPTTWVWRRWRGGAEPFARVRGWRVLITAPQSQSAGGHAGSPLSTTPIAHQVSAILGYIEQWVPEGEFSNGRIEIVPAQLTLKVPAAHWERGVLKTRVGLDQRFISGSNSLPVEVEVSHGSHIRLQIDRWNLAAEVQLHSDAASWQIDTRQRWGTNLVEGSVRFGRRGGMPETAHFETAGLRLPVTNLLGGLVEEVQCAGTFRWETNQYILNLGAQVRTSEPRLPRANGTITLTGDTTQATIEELEVTSPGANFRLQPGVRLGFKTPYLRDPCSAHGWVDVDALSRSQVGGRMDVELKALPGPEGTVPVQFLVESDELRISNVPPARVRMEGAVAWPWLTVETAKLTWTNGSAASLSGRVELSERRVAKATVQITNRLDLDLGSSLRLGVFGLTSNLDGPWPELEHAGQADAEVIQWGPTSPTRLHVEWQGTGLRIPSWQVEASAQQSTLRAAGRMEMELTPPHLKAGVRELTLARQQVKVLTLEQPFGIQIGQATTNLTMDCEEWRWVGKDQEIQFAGHLSGRTEGAVKAGLRGLDSTNFADFFPLNFGELKLESLQVGASWSNTPLRLSLLMTNLALQREALRLGASAALEVDDKGITLSSALITHQDRLLATAHGFVPLTVHPAATTSRVQVNEGAAMALSLDMVPDPSLWEQVPELGKLRVREPRVHGELSGHWGEPEGSIDLQVRELSWQGTPRDYPAVSDLSVQLKVAPRELRLEQLRLKLAGQSIHADGRVPLDAGAWTKILEQQQVPDLGAAEARVQVDHAALSALAAPFTDQLGPDGTLNAQLSWNSGTWHGLLTVDGASTRPLGNLGALRDVDLICRVDNSKVQCRSSGALAGQPIALTADLTLPKEFWRPWPELPQFEAHIVGTNIALARQPEAIIRSDLDLRVEHRTNTVPVISGTVRLRDSLYLQDLRTLVPGHVETPTGRPPYFQVESGPVAAWRLDANVEGKRFLKVQSPLFTGVASANLHLEGTLREPVAVGEVKLDSGLVRLPFASLPITQGSVTLSRANPYQLELYVTAAERTFGYDVRMEVTGPAERPLIQFSSIPPLNSEQVLMMLTTGQLPRADFTFTSQERAQQTAVFVGRSLLSELGFSSEANRLTIRSGETLSEEGKPTYSVEYRLSRDWSVIGQYDRFNDLNLMLKWRFYTR